jgi:DNA-binding response OmpR family regulator
MPETRFTKMEAGVLDLLERNAGQIVTRTFFLENLWGYKDGVKSRTLEVHISKLRAKGLCINKRFILLPVISYSSNRRGMGGVPD